MTKAQRAEQKDARHLKLTTGLKETGVYFAAVVGTFLSPYTESWMANEPVKILLPAGAVLRALAFGLVAVAAMKYLIDRGGKGHPAKLENWKKRAVISFIMGLAINYVWPLVLKLLGGSVS